MFCMVLVSVHCIDENAFKNTLNLKEIRRPGHSREIKPQRHRIFEHKNTVQLV
jgi:hypothetical protein